MKIRQVTAELFHADGGTDRHEEAEWSLWAILRTRLKIYTASVIQLGSANI